MFNDVWFFDFAMFSWYFLLHELFNMSKEHRLEKELNSFQIRYRFEGGGRQYKEKSLTSLEAWRNLSKLGNSL